MCFLPWVWASVGVVRRDRVAKKAIEKYSLGDHLKDGLKLGGFERSFSNI